MPPLSRAQVDAACAPFRGEIEQLVPAYSAVRFGGRRGYELARAGEPVPEKRRRVQVALDVRDVAGDRVVLAVTCSKGTYVRSLARDVGELLGVGGILSSLRREAIGSFLRENAYAWKGEREHRAEDVLKAFIPHHKLLEMMNEECRMQN